MPRPDRKSRKHKETSNHLAQVAAELFERDGFQAVTMEQIAAEADVARGTLYNHFPVKEAVLTHWMHARLQSDLEPLMRKVMSQTSFAARIAALFKASARWWEQHRQYAAPYVRHRFQDVRDGNTESDSSDMIAAYSHLIAQAQETHEIRADASPLRLARYLHFLYLSAVMTWLANEDRSLSDELSQVLEFFLKGAASPPPAKR